MKKTQNAFTIVETMVTLLAITIMLTAPLSFMTRSYNYAEIITAKMIATGLSQEGLELATSYRNKNLVDFQLKASACSSSCLIDWDGVAETPTIDTCSGESCRLNTIDMQNGLYRAPAAGGTATDFYRYLTFTANGAQSYTVESIAYKEVNGIQVAVKLKKVISNITIK